MFGGDRGGVGRRNRRKEDFVQFIEGDFDTGVAILGIKVAECL